MPTINPSKKLLACGNRYASPVGTSNSGHPGTVSRTPSKQIRTPPVCYLVGDDYRLRQKPISSPASKQTVLDTSSAQRKERVEQVGLKKWRVNLDFVKAAEFLIIFAEEAKFRRRGTCPETKFTYSNFRAQRDAWGFAPLPELVNSRLSSSLKPEEVIPMCKTCSFMRRFSPARRAVFVNAASTVESRTNVAEDRETIAPHASRQYVNIARLTSKQRAWLLQCKSPGQRGRIGSFL